MPILKRADAEIYYEEYGSGYPVLLLAPGGMRSQMGMWHSPAGGPPRAWNDWTEVLAKNYRVIAMDQRNAGGQSRAPITAFDDLSLPEITALASRSSIFVGNDSGIAHIAAAVNTPSVVVFGSSNRDNWRPWTDAPNEIVFEPFPCQPCPGYVCKEFGEPRCILSVRPEQVFEAIDKVLATK